jgi:hypothetical protein
MRGAIVKRVNQLRSIGGPFSWACAAIVAVGCGGPAYEYDSVVTGTVTVDGELAKTGTVTFHPVEQGRPAMGRVHSDGSYSLRTGQGDLSQVDGGTIASGEYLVTARIVGPSPEGAATAEGGPPKPGPSLIAAKYRDKETTDLRYTVKPGEQVIVLNLERPEPAAEVTTDEPADDSAPDGPTGDTATQEPPAENAPDGAAPRAVEPPAEEPAPSDDAVEEPAEKPATSETQAL